MKTPRFFLGTDRSLRYEDGPSTLVIGGKLLDQTFTGSINLTNDLTAYKNYTPASNIDVTIAGNPVVGGSAEIRMIGNGVNTPTFTTFVISASSDVYDNTLAAINKIIFYYDGTSAFYSIKVL